MITKIGLDIDLASNGWQANIWTNADQNQWYIYVALREMS